LYFIFENEDEASSVRQLVQEYRPKCVTNRVPKSKLTQIEDVSSLKRRKSSPTECQNNSESALVVPQSSLNSNDFSLSPTQSRILQSCLDGTNIFFTGGAGTGKSTLLKALVKALTQKFGNQSVYITATTGLAACSIGGVTIHQFGGIKAKDVLSFTQGSRAHTTIQVLHLIPHPLCTTLTFFTEFCCQKVETSSSSHR
jgi:ATPase subunit of ABC transporter with duplicated ATPase domains